jgi:uncharacterized membrane protein (UPF0136 family)
MCNHYLQLVLALGPLIPRSATSCCTSGRYELPLVAHCPSGLRKGSSGDKIQSGCRPDWSWNGGYNERSRDDAWVRRCSLDRCGPTDERDGHGGCDTLRVVRVVSRPVGGDDGGHDAAGRGAGSLERRPSRRSRGLCTVVRRVIPFRLDADRPHGSTAAGAVTIMAGFYELTPLKQYFRQRCRESIRSGFEFGFCCFGSSTGLMLMLVALGAMSVTWMTVIAVVSVAQKLLPARAAIDVPLALLIVGFGALVLIAPSSVPGLLPPM